MERHGEIIVNMIITEMTEDEWDELTEEIADLIFDKWERFDGFMSADRKWVEDA